jgi:predicted DNA-binding transcriptional regulator AlpA
VVKLTIDEVAAFFRVHRNTIELWLRTRQGFPRYEQAGRRRLWIAAEIEAYARAQVVK